MKYVNPASVLSKAWVRKCLAGGARRRLNFYHSWRENVVEVCTALGLQHRWAGILAVALQRGVAHVIADGFGADLGRTELEPAVMLADLAAV